MLSFSLSFIQKLASFLRIDCSISVTFDVKPCHIFLPVAFYPFVLTKILSDALDFAKLFPNSSHQARCLAFSGTLILKGSATCIVYATGDRTFLGALRVPVRLVGLMLVVISDSNITQLL